MASGDVFPKLLNSPDFVGTSSSTLFTVATGHQYVIKQIIICNTDGVDRWIKLAIGATSTPENCFVFQLPVAGYDTVIIDSGIILEADQTLQGSSDVADKLTVTTTGWDKTL
jgi:hypothetical protein